jgi:hypothetical protein
MRIILKTDVKVSVEEDLRNLNLLLEEHSSDYNLNGFKVKMVSLHDLDEPDILLVKDQEVRISD